MKLSEQVMASQHSIYVALCLASLPFLATASQMKLDHAAVSSRHVDHVARTTGAEPTALHGKGGGFDVLQSEDTFYYRPWKTRFDAQPYDVNDVAFLKPENRMSYRYLNAANPLLPLAPNSHDRQAQTNVMMVFGLTALGTVVGAVLIADQMQTVASPDLDAADHQKATIRIGVLAAVPWLALAAWCLTIWITFLDHPLRDASVYCWQCKAMVWFLLIAPAINAMYFTVHALWASQVFHKVELKDTPMGRMMAQANEKAGSYTIARILNQVTGPTPRHVLLFLQVACACFGFMLLTFRWGANSQYCQPEVYWATFAFVFTVVIIVVFTAISFFLSLLIRAYADAPWLDDFLGSFWEASALAKAERHEQKMAKEAAAVEVRKAELEYEGAFHDWYEIEKEQEAARKLHKEICDAHDDYKAAVSAEAPQRPKKEPKPVEDEGFFAFGFGAGSEEKDDAQLQLEDDPAVGVTSNSTGSRFIGMVEADRRVLPPIVDASIAIPQQHLPSVGFSSAFGQGSVPSAAFPQVAMSSMAFALPSGGAPVAVPVTMPVAVPVAVPVAMPVAMPVTMPVAMPVAPGQVGLGVASVSPAGSVTSVATIPAADPAVSYPVANSFGSEAVETGRTYQTAEPFATFSQVPSSSAVKREETPLEV